MQLPGPDYSYKDYGAATYTCAVCGKTGGRMGGYCKENDWHAHLCEIEMGDFGKPQVAPSEITAMCTPCFLAAGRETRITRELMRCPRHDHPFVTGEG